MNNICENFRQIIINSLEDIKNLKNKTIQKSDNSFVSEGDMLVQKLITKEIKEKFTLQKIKLIQMLLEKI